MPNELGAQPNTRSNKVVVITRLYYPPDPAGTKYEQYCQQSLMKYKSFRTGSFAPSSLEEDLQVYQQQQNPTNDEVYVLL